MVNGILLAGGYGVVGSLIAADLAADFRVVIAGRNLVRANAVAAAIGHGVSGRKMDVLDNDSIATALSDIGLVVSCIDQPRRGLLHAALKRGIAYTDITPHLVALAEEPPTSRSMRLRRRREPVWCSAPESFQEFPT